MRLVELAAGLTILLLTHALPARAWTSPLEGAPVLLQDLTIAPTGLYYWVDEHDRLHIRVLGEGTYHLELRLRYGQFANIEVTDGRGRMEIERNEDKDILWVDVRGSAQLAGLRFEVGGNRVQLACKLDGDDCPTERVWLGRDSQNPDGWPLLVSRKE